MPEGYTLKDLMKPERVKVQKALSGIINLQKFRESVQDEYDAHVQKSVRAQAPRAQQAAFVRVNPRDSSTRINDVEASLRFGVRLPMQMDLMAERKAVEQEAEALKAELASLR